MSKMPRQKPGRSKQDYCTPPEFLAAVRERLRIGSFDIDVAASPENAICINFYTEKENGLSQSWYVSRGGWAWCNPPFSDIEPWVQNACKQVYDTGANTAMLVPASVGSNWWYSFVHDFAHVLFLNGRLCFIPNWKELGFKQKPLYPKDCALLLYTPYVFGGYDVWDWGSNDEL